MKAPPQVGMASRDLSSPVDKWEGPARGADSDGMALSSLASPFLSGPAAPGAGESPGLVICRDADLVGPVLASAAAVGRLVEVVDDPGGVSRWWQRADVVVVGVECAAMVAGLSLPARSGVYVVGRSADEVLSWSVPMAASVVVLPDQIGLLGPILASDISQALGQVVSVSGGSGGVGASTVACGLAYAAFSRGLRASVCELDPFGGGLDVMCGADAEPGWRWRELAGARGHISDLAGHLPHASGVAVVANSPGLTDVGDPAIASVVAALRRAHDVVVLDRPTGPWREGIGVVVVAAEARAVLAARSRMGSWASLPSVVAVRTGVGRRLSPDAVADALGIGRVVEIRDDASCARNLEVGAPPGRGRGRFAKDCASLLKAVVDG